MTTKDQLVEQHIREYKSRGKHIDELLERAHEAAKDLSDDHAIKTELAQIQEKRGELARESENAGKMSLEHWREETIQTAGPMAIWDVVAQKLGDLVEGLGN